MTNWYFTVGWIIGAIIGSVFFIYFLCLIGCNIKRWLFAQPMWGILVEDGEDLAFHLLAFGICMPGLSWVWFYFLWLPTFSIAIITGILFLVKYKITNQLEIKQRKISGQEKVKTLENKIIEDKASYDEVDEYLKLTGYLA